MQLAPWLQPPDYLQSIDRGAQLGLGVRRSDLEQAQMAQRAREQAAQLQQNWSAKMLENQRMTEQNQLVAQNRADTFGLGQQRNLNIASHNLAAEQNTLAGQKQSAATSAAALEESKRWHDLTVGKPTGYQDTQQAKLDRLEFGAAFREQASIPGRITTGNLTPEAGLTLSSNLNDTISAIKIRSTNSTTMANNPLVSNQPLNMGADPGNEARNPMSVRYNPGQGLNPGSDLGNEAMGSLFSPAPQLAPSLSLTNSPAGGTMQNPIPVTTVAPRRMRDKSGKYFLYTGSNPDPSKDTNPANWTESQ